MTAASAIVALFAIASAMTSIDEDGAEEPVCLQGAGCGFAVAAALFVAGQVL